MDALSCRRQSFCQVWYKSAVDCMRNANKCPEIQENKQELSYRKQIVRQLRKEYVEKINGNFVTLKSRLRIT